MYLSGSEWLFWGGIAAMAAAALLAVLCVAIFYVTGRRLKKKLEEEYGEPQL